MFDSDVVKIFKQMLKDKQEQNFAEYLTELSSDEKIEISPVALKLMIKKFEYSFENWFDAERYYLVQLAAFYTSEFASFKQSFQEQDSLIHRNLILPNKREVQSYFSTISTQRFKYYALLKCLEKNQYEFSEFMIANILSRSYTDIGCWHQITFREHLWLLFRYETNIHNKYEGRYFWNVIFRALHDHKLLPRQQMLQESLLSPTRFSNHLITGFFFEFIDYADPTTEELISLQEYLFLSLSSQNFKPLNRTLKYIKTICEVPGFDLNGFLEYVPLLLAQDVKAVVNATLGISNILIKHYSTRRKEIALLLTHALSHTDESIQTKTLKLLAKHKMLEDTAILDEITLYSDGLFHGAKQLLPTMPEQSAEDSDGTTVTAPLPKIREDNALPTYETFDELVFFFSQAFDQNTPYDFDLFTAFLPRLNSLLTPENVSKIEPSFQRAFQFYKSSQNIDKTVSQITLAMAQAMLYFGHKFMDKFPDTLSKVDQYYEEMVDYETKESENYHWYKSKLIRFEELENGPSVYHIYRHLLAGVLKSLKNRNQLPLLSTPTHAPCWIESDILIQRLQTYNDCPGQINLYDLQIALSRVIVEPKKTEEINRALSGEIRDVLLYLFGNEALSLEQVQHPEYWLTPVLRRRQSQDCERFKNCYADVDTDEKLISPTAMKISRKSWENYGKKSWSSTLVLSKTNMLSKLKFDSVYHHVAVKKQHDPIHSYDEQNLLYLTPTVPYYLLDAFMKHDDINAASSLINLWSEFHEAVYPYVALAFLKENKTERFLAAELWIKTVSEGTMNSALLGKTLGKLEAGEYAPLKRFTDLIVSNMLGISTLHNKALETVISNMIPAMSDVPITGTKKLLELYLEVLVQNGSRASGEVLEKLTIWERVKSVSALAKKLRNHNERI